MIHVTIKNYHPKGRMCAICRYKHSDCSDLDFSKMQPISKVENDDYVVVKCSKFINELD